jgi:hypothetical protein
MFYGDSFSLSFHGVIQVVNLSPSRLHILNFFSTACQLLGNCSPLRYVRNLFYLLPLRAEWPEYRRSGRGILESPISAYAGFSPWMRRLNGRTLDRNRDC